MAGAGVGGPQPAASAAASLGLGISDLLATPLDSDAVFSFGLGLGGGGAGALDALLPPLADVEPGPDGDSAQAANARAVPLALRQPAAQRSASGGDSGGGSSAALRGAADEACGASGESDDTSDSLLERLTLAMGELMAPTGGAGASAVQGALVQVWLPQPSGRADSPGASDGSGPHSSPTGDAGILATRGQPFSVSASASSGANCDALAAFRYASTHYAFVPSGPHAAGSGLPVGMPGRVFTSGRAELSPDVQLYDRAQYVRLPDAVQCGIRGTLVMPVFDDASKRPLTGSPPSASSAARRRPAAVIEVATSRVDVEWGAVIERVAGVLQRARLSTSTTARVDAAAVARHSPPPLSARSLACISSLVTRAAATHGVAFAQAWRLTLPNASPAAAAGAPANPQCSDGDTTADKPASPSPPCLQADGLPHAVAPGAAGHPIAAFRAMCCNTPLCEGQGLPGVALTRGSAEWTGDGEAFDITAYPLRHFAHAAGLRSGCALRLELPPADGGGAIVMEVLSRDAPPDAPGAAALLAHFNVLLKALAAAAEEAGLTPCRPLARKRGARDAGDDAGRSAAAAAAAAAPAPLPAEGDPWADGAEDDDEDDDEMDDDVGAPVQGGGGASAAAAAAAAAAAKRTLTREVLYEHFAYGLKEAAERLEMCPTTLKRICRTHGVARWPSRKKYRDVLAPRMAIGIDAAVEVMTGGAAPNAKRRTSLDDARGTRPAPQATVPPAAAPALPLRHAVLSEAAGQGGAVGSLHGSAAPPPLPVATKASLHSSGGSASGSGSGGALLFPGDHFGGAEPLGEPQALPAQHGTGSFGDLSDGALWNNPRSHDAGSGHGKLNFVGIAVPGAAQPPAPSALGAPAGGQPLLGHVPAGAWPVGVAFHAPPASAQLADAFAIAGANPPFGMAPPGAAAGACLLVGSPPVTAPAMPTGAAGASRFCHTCGAPLKKPGAAFCHMCGIKQDE